MKRRGLNSARLLALVAALSFQALHLSSAPARVELAIDTLIGPVTQNEINSFKAFIQNQVPPNAPWDFRHNAWSFGPGGRNLEALGMMYEL